MSTVIKWHDKKFKEELVKKLERNGRLVGNFVEAQARRRLLAIREPDWGRGYRRGIVNNLLTNYVERGENEIVITVGVRASARGRHHGYYIELGSSKYPAQPFLRPAVFQNKKAILELLVGGE